MPPALNGIGVQESGSPPGVAHFTANPDNGATEVCGARFVVAGSGRVLGASGTFTMSKRDGEIKLRIGPPSCQGFCITYLDKRAHPTCTHFLVGVSTTASQKSYNWRSSGNRGLSGA